jgi:pilus assembly protein Flp/PilA
MTDAVPGQRFRTVSVPSGTASFDPSGGVHACRLTKEFPMFDTLLAYVQTFTTKLRRDDRGATMIEYGLMVALIAVIVAAAVGPLGIAIAGMFTGIIASV